MSAPPHPEPGPTDPATTDRAADERTRAEIVAYLAVGRRMAGPGTVARLVDEAMADDG